MDWKAYRVEEQARRNAFVDCCRKIGAKAVIAGLEMSGVLVTSEMRWAAARSHLPDFVWEA